QRAWNRLIVKGDLWRGCQQVVQNRQSVPLFGACYEALLAAGAQNAARRLHPGEPDEGERLLKAARRTVAAAAVATLVRQAPAGAAAEADLLLWLYRAVTLGPGAPPAGLSLPVDGLPSRRPVKRVRRYFTSLAARRAPDWQLPAAHPAVLLFLDALRPAPRLARIPVPLVGDGGRGEGLVARLSVHLFAPGFGEFFPHPRMFLSFGGRW